MWTLVATQLANRKTGESCLHPVRECRGLPQRCAGLPVRQASDLATSP
jgi:hypothetical protein